VTQGKKIAVRNRPRILRVGSLSATANSSASVIIRGTCTTKNMQVLVSARMNTGSWVSLTILAKPPKLKFMPLPTWKLIQSDQMIG